jgi:PAS domain S-box-containing protein
MARKGSERFQEKMFSDMKSGGESSPSLGRVKRFVLRNVLDMTARTTTERLLREEVDDLQAELTESRQAREAVQYQLHQLRKFERTTSELFWTMDLEGTFTYMSPSSEHLWGYRPEELMEMNLSDYMTPASLALAAEVSRKSTAAIQAGNRPETQRIELEQFGKDGVPIWSEVVVEYVFDDDGVFLEKRGVTRDITKRKQHELLLEEARIVAEATTAAMEAEVSVRRGIQEALLIQHNQLEALNVALEAQVAQEVLENRKKYMTLMYMDKLASVGQLAAGMAHEINNPLGFVSCNLEILAGYFRKIIRSDELLQANLKDLPGQNVRELLCRERASLNIGEILADGVDLIQESLDGAHRITKIVHDLKSYSRVDAAEEEWVTLDSCLESALSVCFKELNFVADIRKEYEPTVSILCHAGEMNHLFMNLLVNAAQAMTSRGEILLRSWQDDAVVSVSVSDTGSGMSEEILARIFEPFFTTKDVGKGTGLGLSVSHEIVRRHCGSLLVSSSEGVGTTFTVVMPKQREVQS